LHPLHAHLNPSCHILIVDRSATMRARLKRVVRDAGLPATRVFEAADGAEALELLLVHHVDLAVVDLGLASVHGEGRDLIGRIVSEPATRSVCVVAMAPGPVPSDPRMLKRLRRRGIRACLPRPFTAQALRVAVADVLELSLA
jgi:two-component system, chemotaxis family, chemotaxis protein CheY